MNEAARTQCRSPLTATHREDPRTGLQANSERNGWTVRLSHGLVGNRPDAGGRSLWSASVMQSTPLYPIRHARRRSLALFAAALIALLALGLPAPARADRHVGSFRGLGTWVDLYDSALRADPEAAVTQMQADGVRTLYLETSSFQATSAIVSPATVSRFLVAAHADGMRVVAWYLPSLGRPALDRWRSLEAIRFRTSDGQGFDAFALDIESTRVHDAALRTRPRARPRRLRSRRRR